MLDHVSERSTQVLFGRRFITNVQNDRNSDRNSDWEWSNPSRLSPHLVDIRTMLTTRRHFAFSFW